MANLPQDSAKYEELGAFIDSMRDHPGPLMPIMQRAQDIFGALTFDVQEFISEKLDIPMSDIYGVATFYAQFALEPKGRNVVGVCMGTACYVKKADGILKALTETLGVDPGYTTPDGTFTLEATRCLGCCGLAPVMMIGDQVYGRLKPEDVPGILQIYTNKAQGA